MIDELILCRKCFKSHKFVLPFLLKTKDWQKLKIPSLFIVGENDIFLSAHRAVRFLNLVAPKIKTVIIPDAGHDLLIVQSEIICEKILCFLKN